MRHVANSKILVVRPGEANPAAFQPWTEQFGTRVELPPYQEFKEAYEQISGRDFEPDTEAPEARIRRNLGI